MRITTAIVTAVLVTGCAPKSSAIEHFVLIKLENPAEAEALRADCDAMLPGIDGVVSYWSGLPDRSGRDSPTIDSDWDVALCVGYPDAAAYRDYVADPAHVQLVQKWKPAFTWLRIHDVDLTGGD